MIDLFRGITLDLWVVDMFCCYHALKHMIENIHM